MFLNHRSIFLLLLLVLCYSCRTKKLAQDTRTEQNTLRTALEILQTHNQNYDWFSAKAKLKYSDPYDSESGTAYIRIKRDSTVWMTLKKFSVEGFRLSMNKDSIVILNRLEKTYSVSYWDELSERYDSDLNYTKIQDWLVGNVVLPSDTTALDMDIDSTAYYFKYVDESFEYNYKIPLFLNTLSDYTIKDDRDRIVNLFFDDCRKEDDFCYFREYSIPLSNNENVFLRLEISDLEIDIPKKTTFAIPSRYTRI